MAFYTVNSYTSTFSGSSNEVHLDATSTGFEDTAIFGYITDSTTGDPIEGALVRAINNNTGALLGYIYSGCNGVYLLPANSTNLPPGNEVRILVGGNETNRSPFSCT